MKPGSWDIEKADERRSPHCLVAITMIATVTTIYLAEGIAADYDAKGCLAGIEILDAVKRLSDPTVFRQVILEDLAVAKS